MTETLTCLIAVAATVSCLCWFRAWRLSVSSRRVSADVLRLASDRLLQRRYRGRLAHAAACEGCPRCLGERDADEDGRVLAEEAEAYLRREASR